MKVVLFMMLMIRYICLISLPASRVENADYHFSIYNTPNKGAITPSRKVIIFLQKNCNIPAD